MLPESRASALMNRTFSPPLTYRCSPRADDGGRRLTGCIKPEDGVDILPGDVAPLDQVLFGDARQHISEPREVVGSRNDVLRNLAMVNEAFDHRGGQEPVRPRADPDEGVGEGIVAVAPRGDGEDPGAAFAGVFDDGGHMNRAPGKILAPVDDPTGVQKVLDRVVFPGAEVVNARDEPCGVTQGPPGPGGAQAGEKELGRLLEHPFGAVAHDVQDRGRLMAVGVDVLRAEGQRIVPSDGLPMRSPLRKRGRVMRSGERSRRRWCLIFLQMNPDVNGWSGLPRRRTDPSGRRVTSMAQASGQSMVQAVVMVRSVIRFLLTVS